MFKVFKKEIELAGKKISLETGKIARQADGAIIAQCGETVVLATAVGAKKVIAGLECGVTLKDFNDYRKKDIIEAYNTISTDRTI